MITKPIFLCGYTSSGKTTIGKELAKQLHVPFYDTDKLITVKTGHTPNQKGQGHAKRFSASHRSVTDNSVIAALWIPPAKYLFLL